MVHPPDPCFYVFLFISRHNFAPVSLYAKAAVMIAMEYTSLALQPLERSLIGAFNPRRIGPYASKFPSL